MGVDIELLTLSAIGEWTLNELRQVVVLAAGHYRRVACHRCSKEKYSSSGRQQVTDIGDRSSHPAIALVPRALVRPKRVPFDSTKAPSAGIVHIPMPELIDRNGSSRLGAPCRQKVASRRPRMRVRGRTGIGMRLREDGDWAGAPRVGGGPGAPASPREALVRAQSPRQSRYAPHVPRQRLAQYRLTRDQVQLVPGAGQSGVDQLA